MFVDVLTYLATALHLEYFVQVLPLRNNRYMQNSDPENSNIDYSNFNLSNSENCDNDILNEIFCYDTYITVCKETMHANQIKKLITTTGQQLLCTLNL